MALAQPQTLAVARQRQASWLIRVGGPAWPLKALLLGFPLWWALGLASFAFLVAAGIMAGQMLRRGRVRLPAGFGVWVLFLAWMAAGVFVLWAHAPGTVDSGGASRLIGFGLRVLWYLAITVAMLYPLSLPSRVLPAIQVARWLGFLFLVVAFLGLLGVFTPTFEFTSLAERVVPGAGSDGWLRTMVHPALTTSSDFLGYEQPRPKAPFAYPNAWGNNLGLLLPFFVYGWARDLQRWQRASLAVMLGVVLVVGVITLQPVVVLGLVAVVTAILWALSHEALERLVVPMVLVLATVPIAASLNRGLWLGLLLMAVYAAITLASQAKFNALLALLAGAGVAAIVFAATPLADTISIRLETPHSNERRATVAETVISATWQGSPLLGYGTTRQVEGSFASIAGGETPDCHQCAAPPLGTQGFLWRLIFTTGFVGTALFYAWVAIQLAAHIRRREMVCIVGSMVLVTSLLYFIVYDSLESPLFILMLAVGLMNRARLERGDATSAASNDPHHRNARSAYT